jgi:hypothetical protein
MAFASVSYLVPNFFEFFLTQSYSTSPLFPIHLPLVLDFFLNVVLLAGQFICVLANNNLKVYHRETRVESPLLTVETEPN